MAQEKNEAFLGSHVPSEMQPLHLQCQLENCGFSASALRSWSNWKTSWLSKGSLRFVGSSDRVAWSESQILEAMSIVHRMLEASVGFEVGGWEDLCAKLQIGTLGTDALTFGTTRRKADNEQ